MYESDHHNPSPSAKISKFSVNFYFGLMGAGTGDTKPLSQVRASSSAPADVLRLIKALVNHVALPSYIKNSFIILPLV